MEWFLDKFLSLFLGYADYNKSSSVLPTTLGHVPQSTLLPSDLQSWTKLLRKLYTGTAFFYFPGLYLTGKGDLQPLMQPNKPVLYKCSSFQRQVDN